MPRTGTDVALGIAREAEWAVTWAPPVRFFGPRTQMMAPPRQSLAVCREIGATVPGA
jgi:hypothetical protein